MRQERLIKGVQSVVFSGPGSLHLTQGEKETLAVSASAGVLTELRSRLRQGTLHLGVGRREVTPLALMRESVRWDLQVRELQKLVMTGAGLVEIPDLDMDELTVELQGSGNMNFTHLTADKLRIELAGSGRIVLAGDVESQRVRVAGSGGYEAIDLVSDYGSIILAGSGTADVAVNDDLDVQIMGTGKVSYAGYPEVTKRISGSGKLTRIRRPAARRSS